MKLDTPRYAYLYLLAVIGSAAVTPIFIRNAQAEGVPSLYIIVVRLILVTLWLTPITVRRYRPDLARLQPRDWGLALLAGFLFALNLILLFISLEFTSVMITSVLRRTSPLWVIGLEIVFLKAVFSRRVWLGLFLALGGSLLVGIGGAAAINPGSKPLLGAMLALIGAISMGIYLPIGRKLSQQIPPLAYSWLVFGAAAVVALILALASRTPFWGYTAMGYIWILVVTVVAQVIGHIGINAGLRYFPATYVSIALLISVAVGTVLALVIFGEIPSLLQVVGSIIIVVGVVITSVRRD